MKIIDEYYNQIVAILLGVCIMLMVFTCIACADEFTICEIADAVFMAEGGYGATFLYGIRSISYENEAEARRICLNSIRNAYKRWDKQGDFLEFMSRRYCPIKAKNDPKGLNVNWVFNVKFWLVKNRKEEER